MSAEERLRLLDERRLVEASLDDVASEVASGELDEATALGLLERDRARLDEIDAALAALGDEVVVPAAPPDDGGTADDHGRRRWWLLVVGALALIVALTVILVARAGQSADPSVAQLQGLLVRADALSQQGKVTEALALYAKVLASDPTQPEALSQSGFLTFEAGLSTGSSQLTARGEAQVRSAAALAPKDFAPRLYLGVIDLLGNADPKAALKEFAAFRALDPPAKWLRRAQPYIDKATAAVQTTTTVPG